MGLANRQRYSRLANVKAACNFGVWDVSQVECNNGRLDRYISRHEEGRVGSEMKNS
jgi:hypothetical protein